MSMRLPEDILRIVITHLDPGEGIASTKALASFCHSSRLFLQIARQQLHSLVRIDDMRCKMDLSYVKTEVALYGYTRCAPGKWTGSECIWWLKTVFREKENTSDEQRWKAWKARKAGRRATGIEDQEDSEDEEFDEREFWPDIELFDDADDDAYGYAYEYGPEDLPKLRPYDWGPSDILDPFSFVELRSLETFPHLGRHIKTIDFHGRTEGKPTALILERFLKVCPNVDTIVLARGQVRYLEDSIRALKHIVAYTSDLKSLTITDFGDDQAVPEFFQAIAKLNKLKYLSLTLTPAAPSYVTEISPSMFDPLILPNSLTSFHLGSVATPEFYEGLSDSFVSSIISLGIAVRRSIPDISRFNNIEHLTITFGYLSQAIELLETVSTSQTIKSLELRYSNLIDRTEFQRRKHQDEDREFQDFDSGDVNEEIEEDVEARGGEGSAVDEESRIKLKPKQNSRELDSFVDLFDYLPPKLESLTILQVLRYPLDEDFEKAIRTKLPESIRQIGILAKNGDEYDSDYESGKTDRKKETWLDRLSKLLEEEKGVGLVRVEEKYGGEERSAMMGKVRGWLRLRQDCREESESP